MRLTILLASLTTAAALAAPAAAAPAPYVFEHAAAGAYPVPTGRVSELALDVDGDGRVDRVVADYGAGVVAFLATGATTTAWAPEAWTLASGDLNEDGRPDIVVGTSRVTSEAADTAVSRVLLNDGRGGFTQPASGLLGIEGQASSAAIADIDGDGHQDVAVASVQGPIQIWLGDGRGGVRATPFPSPLVSWSSDRLVASDFDGDGWVDLGASSSEGRTTDILLNKARTDWSAPAISGPTRCFSGGRARFVVRGSEITKVSAQLDDAPTLQTLHHPNTHRDGFLLSFPTSRLRPGRHTVHVGVTFASGGGTTLKATLRRCAAPKRR